jgi:hypothetical protein
MNGHWDVRGHTFRNDGMEIRVSVGLLKTKTSNNEFISSNLNYDNWKKSGSMFSRNFFFSKCATVGKTKSQNFFQIFDVTLLIASIASFGGSTTSRVKYAT